MSDLLEGVRVLEVSTWGFVPTCGVILAEWGADVIKVEHPSNPDPARSVVTSNFRTTSSGMHVLFELFNRGKRSVAIDLGTPAGREVFYRMLTTADVFLTNLRESARRHLGIDATELRRRFPGLVYAAGSGMGPKGPERNEPAFDLSTFWSRSGVAHAVTPNGAAYPSAMPAAGFGDITAGTSLSGAIAAALFRRQRTGEGATVDVSLLNAGMWAMATEIAGVDAFDVERFYQGDPRLNANPLQATYRTKDGRFLQLVMTQGDKWWPDLCRRIGRPELADDDRFAEGAQRKENASECVRLLDESFAQRTADEWRVALAGSDGPWTIVQTPRDLLSDPQVVANDYVKLYEDGKGREYRAVRGPSLLVDEPSPTVRPAPDHGEHTEEILLESGYSWDDLLELKIEGAIL